MSDRGRSMRLRSTSDLGLGTPKSRGKDNATSARRARSKAKVIEEKRVKPAEKLVGISAITQSTPINSPPSLMEKLEINQQGAISKINDEIMSKYLTTPLAPSARTVLISTPAPLPSISSNSSIGEVNDYLDALINNIGDFENIVVANPDWKTSRHTRYTFLSDCISNARFVGIKNKFLTVSLRCSKLSIKLDEIKMNLSMRCKNDTLNNFHGFSTIAETSNIVHTKIGEANKSVEPNPKSIEERLKTLETCVLSFNSLNAQVPQLGERIAVLEDSNHIDVSKRVIKLEQIYSNLNNSDEIITVNRRITNTEARIEVNEDTCSKHDWQLNQLIQVKDSMENELNSFKKATVAEMEELRNSVQPINNAFPTFVCQDEPSFPNKTVPHKIFPLNPEYSNYKRAVSATAAKSILETNNQNISKWLASSNNLHFDSIPKNKTNNYERISKEENQKLPDQCQVTSHEKPEHVENLHSSRHKHHPDPGDHKHTTAPTRTSSDSDGTASISSIGSSRISSMNVQGRILKSNMKGLKKLLNPNPLNGVSKCTLTDIYKNRLVTADIQCRELKKDLKDYFKLPNHDIQLCESVSDTIEDCINWCAEVREMYHKQGIHKKSQATKLYDTLTQFTKHSEVNVYDFFQRYSAYTEEFDIPEEKAELLFNKFLDVEIQDEVAEYKDDFNSMKRVLFHRYGDQNHHFRHSHSSIKMF